MAVLCECGCGQFASASRFIRGHNVAPPVAPPREEDRGYDTPCLIWQGALNGCGYGHTSAGLAYRVAYEREVGEVPHGAHLDHLCRQPACVRVDHLELVTPAENARRGRRAKLTYAAVEEIRELLAAGWLQKEIAGLFGVARCTVSDIHQGRTWSAPGGVIRGA